MISLCRSKNKKSNLTEELTDQRNGKIDTVIQCPAINDTSTYANNEEVG